MLWVMSTLDLFTGVGGFVQGLKDVSSPLLYCDSSPLVRTFIHSLISRKLIPDAPFVCDVANLETMIDIVGDVDVHMITAGFPCVGFSSVGQRKGLQDARSGLFFQVARIVDHFRPQDVLFENVARIVSSNQGADLELIVETMSTLGYDSKWTVCSANEVGLPQVRKRWFCLCTRRDSSCQHTVTTYSESLLFATLRITFRDLRSEINRARPGCRYLSGEQST